MNESEFQKIAGQTIEDLQDAIDNSGADIDYDVECEDCNFVETFTVIDWDELMEKMNESGWTKQCIQGTWNHFCEDHS